MKISLNLDDRVIEDAKKLSAETGQSVSEIISLWSMAGRDFWKKNRKKKKNFTPVDLGEIKIDLISRDEWMDVLDDDI